MSTAFVLLKPYFEGLYSTWVMSWSSTPRWVSSMVNIFKKELVIPWDQLIKSFWQNTFEK